VFESKVPVWDTAPDNWRELTNSKTDCRISAYESGVFPVVGALDLRQAQIPFLTPACRIQNATMSREAMPNKRPNGGPTFDLRHGETIVITPSGGVKRLRQSGKPGTD
jgi:hypothetical protein